MRLHFVLALLALSGCSTQQVRLQDLMRTSYYVGCAEARFKYIKGPLEAHKAQTEGVVSLCKEESQNFNLNQTGIYNDRMEVFQRPNRLEGR